MFCCGAQTGPTSRGRPAEKQKPKMWPRSPKAKEKMPRARARARGTQEVFVWQRSAHWGQPQPTATATATAVYLKDPLAKMQFLAV